MRHRESIYDARRRHIMDVCKKYDTQGWRAKSHRGHQIWLDLTHGLAACLHAKVKRTLGLPYFFLLCHCHVTLSHDSSWQQKLIFSRDIKTEIHDRL